MKTYLILFALSTILMYVPEMATILQIAEMDGSELGATIKAISGITMTSFLLIVVWQLRNLIVRMYDEMKEERRYYEEQRQRIIEQAREDARLLSERAQAIIDNYRSDLVSYQKYFQSFFLEYVEKKNTELYELIDKLNKNQKSV